jgi:hypothetical protein
VGVSPGTDISGFGPGTIEGNDGNVAFHTADAAAASAKAGLGLMFTDAMAALNEGDAPPTALAAGIGDGQILFPGVYSAAADLDIAGSLVLDAQGDVDAVFIFQIQSALSLTGTVSLLNPTTATASNVFWAVGSSVTIAKNSAMTGIIMAYQSITMDTDASLNGAALAREAAVTFVTNTVSLDGQASDALATCTGCTSLYTLENGKCILGTTPQEATATTDLTTAPATTSPLASSESTLPDTSVTVVVLGSTAAPTSTEVEQTDDDEKQEAENTDPKNAKNGGTSDVFSHSVGGLHVLVWSVVAVLGSL